MPFYHFPEFYWTQNPDHDKLKEKIKLSNTKPRKSGEGLSFSLCNVISSYPHTDPYNLFLKDWKLNIL